jgi:hypothetical protein
MTQLHPFSTRLSGGLIARLAAAEKATGLGVQDLLRLALERGLPIVEAQLASVVDVPVITLPDRVIQEATIDRLVRNRKASK